MQEYLNRAWPENDALLHELLELRREHARLLGYDGWPSYDAEVKMIGKGAAIPEFVDRITDVSTTAARRDFDVLLARLQQDHPEVSSRRQRRQGCSTPRCCAASGSTWTPSRSGPTSTSRRCGPGCSR